MKTISAIVFICAFFAFAYNYKPGMLEKQQVFELIIVRGEVNGNTVTESNTTTRPKGINPCDSLELWGRQILKASPNTLRISLWKGGEKICDLQRNQIVASE